MFYGAEDVGIAAAEEGKVFRCGLSGKSFFLTAPFISLAPRNRAVEHSRDEKWYRWGALRRLSRSLSLSLSLFSDPNIRVPGKKAFRK